MIRTHLDTFNNQFNIHFKNHFDFIFKKLNKRLKTAFILNNNRIIEYMGFKKGSVKC